MIKRANFKDSKVIIREHMQIIKKGSFWETSKNMKKIWSWGSESKVSRFLKLLTLESMITMEQTGIGPIICISRYSDYQDISNYFEGNSDEQVTSKCIPTGGASGGALDDIRKNLKQLNNLKKENNNTPPISPKGEIVKKPKSKKVKVESEYPEHFEKFWSLWPKKKGGTKSKGFKAWDKYDFETNEENRKMVFEKLQENLEHNQKWKEGIYIQNVSTALNEKFWETVVPRGELVIVDSKKQIQPTTEEKRKWFKEMKNRSKNLMDS